MISMDANTKDIRALPFVKWAGGKRSIMNELVSRMPCDVIKYHEPFVGGGAVFFAMDFDYASLSDLNSDLVNVYNVVKDMPNELIQLLKEHDANNSKEYFYDIRLQHDLEIPLEVAARFVYLNKTCFNGLYRVNKSGKFNVPFGSYKKPNIVQEDNIIACHNALVKTSISNCAYDDIDAISGDFVYFDPPYYPKDDKSFTSYTKYGFNREDHIMLRDFALELCNDGVKVMISNSDVGFVRELYDIPQFRIDSIFAARNISCNGKNRKPVGELIITGGYDYETGRRDC